MLKMSLRKKLFPIFIFAAAAAGLAAPADAATISEIVVQGNRRIATDSVESLISLKAGEEYDESKIPDDIRKMYATGNFDDVTVEKNLLPSGVRVIYTVRENPILTDLSFTGNKKLDDDKIKKALSLRTSSIVGKSKIHEESRKIARLYSASGYGSAKVSYTIEPEAQGAISVVYNIEEGPRATIASVRIIGNKKIKTRKLKKRIFSAPHRFYSLGKKGLYIRELVLRDTEIIRAIYQNEGYINAQVAFPLVKRNPSDNSHDITFEIDEGRKFFVAEISLSGIEPPPDVSEEEILHDIPLKKGKPYGRNKLRASIGLISSVYSNKGYANVNVEPQVRARITDEKKPELVVKFVVERGEIFHIGRINITGNDKTIDKVIRREIEISEGDIYKSGEISLIKPRVGRLGFFDNRSIQVTTSKSKERENELDINIAVREASTAQINLGAGVSSIEDFIFFGSIREANFLGYGKTLEARANFGEITDTYSFRYSDRNFLDTKWTFDISASHTELDYDEYDRVSTGGIIGIGRALYRQLWGRLYYRLEKGEIKNPARNSNIRPATGITSAVGAELSLDNRDNLRFPTSGYRTIAVFEHSGHFGGDSNLSKLIFEGSVWIPVFKGSFLAMKARYDRVFFRGENFHAVDERLFLGGSNDLRGFDYRDVRIPRQPSLGGTERIYGKADFVIPVPFLKSVGFYGVLFYDIGNVFDPDRGAPFSINPSDLRKDYGYGFWWNSPLGLIKVELGYPVDRRGREERKQINFSIGASF